MAAGTGDVVRPEDSRFLASFLILSVVSGLTVGLGKIVTTLYAISLNATPFQIGVISAMESVGMVLVTVPAGFVIARYGARWVYFLSSLGPMLVNLAMPFSTGWLALALGRWSIGLLAAGAVLLALGSAAVHLVNIRMLVELPGGKSKVAGVYHLASMTGSSFGALAGGAASKLVSLQDVLLLWLPVLLAAGLAVQVVHHRLVAPAVLATGDA